MPSTQNRPSTSAPGDGSRTTIVHDTQPRPEGSDANSPGPSVSDGTIRLRGGPRSRPRVAWDAGVVDNENCGRKKSKICCIYHKPREFDESSDESSSDDDSNSDDGRARPSRRAHHHHHHHHDPHPNGGSSDGGSSGSGGGNALRNGGDGGAVVHELEDPSEPNAYESNPSHFKKGNGRPEV